MLKTVPNHYDVIVLGVGAMGSATIYQLARRGRKVLGLERFDIPHTFGSSHGVTRIIRLAYYEHPSYVDLLRRSYELWREIQAEAGEQLLHIIGSIDAGPADSRVFQGAWRSAKEHDLTHEVFTGPELRRRFPGFNLPPETLALHQPDGGFLLPERCIVNYVMAAQAHGAEVHTPANRSWTGSRTTAASGCGRSTTRTRPTSWSSPPAPGPITLCPSCAA